MKSILKQICLVTCLIGLKRCRLVLSPVFFLITLVLVITGCEKQSGSAITTTNTLDLALIADNLVSPITLVEGPDPSKRLYVVDQIGKIWIIDSDGHKLVNPFLDLSSKIVPLTPQYDERGLLGLAFHPDYAHNGKFYVYYTAPPRAGGPEPGINWNNLSRVSEFTVFSSNPSLADLNSERIVLEEDHPQSNHNGGTIAFGWDGFLYISIGDGGFADDNAPGHVEDWYKVNAGGNGQDVVSNLMGNILRIDINGGHPYAIPGDNPYVGKPGKDEIYAFGFRNPYRFSFDMGGSHQLFVGDAGQVLYEEVSIVTKGGNYGWNVKEGTHCFNTDSNLLERPNCPSVDSAGNPLIDPVIEFENHANPNGHGLGTAVVGGHVYRGKTIPGLEGKYIFGVFSEDFGGGPNGRIFAATPALSGLWPFEDIPLKNHPDNLGQYLKGFGQGLDGEVYLLTTTELGPTGATGQVLKLVMGQ